MKVIFTVLLSFVLPGLMYGQGAGGIGAGGAGSVPSGSGSAVITTNEFDASAIVSGTLDPDRIASSTNQYLANPTLTNATFQGTTAFETVIATNLVGNGSGLTNVLADGFSGRIAAIVVTNNVEDRSSIYVTGNPAAAVNGQYKVAWYYPESFQGVWTNTASTNLIIMNNVSNTAGMNAQPFVIAGTYDAEEFMYQENQSSVGVKNSWINDFTSDGLTLFTGTATLKWATNQTWQMLLVPYAIGRTNSGLIATNIMRVSLTGDDSRANRTNGYPFRTLWYAQDAAEENSGDMILIEPGFYKSHPFHSKRGVHIVGSGPGTTIVEIENFDDPAGPVAFQSRLIVPWENCTVGNFTLTNSAIGFAQFDAFLGGSNIWVYDMTIFPPRQIKFPSISATIGDQQVYYNAGVKVSRIGNNNRLERVKVYSGMHGFAFQTPLGDTTHTFSMVDCEAYCSADYGGPTIWTNNAFLEITNVGGMNPIAFTLQPAVANQTPIILNIQGGKFHSLNGGTNAAEFVGGENQTSRNAGIWISKRYTNDITLNFSGIPQFRYGSSNAPVYSVLDETTNNKVVLSGWYDAAQVHFTTNTTEQPVVNVSQLVNSAGANAISTASMATMDFGTTDPTITVTATGNYAVFANSSGFTSSANTGHTISFQIFSNSVALDSSLVIYDPIDPNLVDMILPWSVALPVTYTPLVSGDTVSLRWQSGGTSWGAKQAHLSIVRLR